MGKANVELGQNDAVTLELDERLADVRKEMFRGWATGSDTIEFTAALVRVAYAKGLMDALKDPAEARGFIRRHGFQVPRAKKGKSATR